MSYVVGLVLGRLGRSVAACLLALGLVCGPAAARAIPEGAAVHFACTQSQFDGPPALRCEQDFDPRYAETFLRGFDRLTPENEFKMAYLEPSQGTFDFSVADQFAAWARANGKTVRGHTLVWGHQLPYWVSNPLLPWTHDALLSAMQTYIGTVVSHFRAAFPDVVQEWDVVNEPVDSAGRVGSSVWSAVIGPEYVAAALTAAHAADPAASLLINQIGADGPNVVSRATLALATSLKQAGVPLDAIGLEAHVTPRTAASLGYLLWLMRQYARVGLKVEITELDVGDDGLVDDPAAKAAVFRRYALACRLSANCTGYTVWGVADQYSWLGPLSDALLYDTDFSPKPVAATVRALLGDRPVTETRRPHGGSPWGRSARSAVERT